MSYQLAIEQLAGDCKSIPMFMIEAIYDTCALRDMALMSGASQSSRAYKAFLDITHDVVDSACEQWAREKKEARVRWGRPPGTGKPRRDWSQATPRLPEKDWLRLRARIFGRDGYVCRYCKRDGDIKWAVDHIIPLSRGGTNDEDNLTVACFQCNSSKSDKLLSEWGGPPKWLR